MKKINVLFGGVAIIIMMIQLMLFMGSKEHHECALLMNTNEAFLDQAKYTAQSYQTKLEKLKHCITRPKISESSYDQIIRHDLNTIQALNKYLKQHNSKKIVGIMGGHILDYDNPSYLKIARFAKQLREHGFVILSGGGSGTMQAVHLGVWFAGRTDKELIQAIDSFKQSSYYNEIEKVQKNYPRNLKGKDVGLIAVEFFERNANNFPSYQAIFTNNALREQTLLLFSTGAIVFFPGGAGTLMEIYWSLVHKNYFNKKIEKRPLFLMNQNFWRKESELIKSKDIDVIDSFDEFLIHFDKKN